MQDIATPDPLPEGPAGQAYRAFWRWHFYAGLIVLPVLMLMALTGGLYLFHGDIDGIVYRRLMTVQDRPVATSPEAWARAAQASAPGRLAQLTPPEGPGRSARLVVETATGERRAVFVDPHDASVQGSIPDGGVMAFVKRLHSLDIAGPVANILVEIVAGWAIVLAATGIFLWWPRGRRGGVVTVRGGPGKRVFWRDLHAVTGILASLVIIFLAVTGMPWSAVWGQQVRKMTTEAGLGRPRPPSGAGVHDTHRPAEDVPWAMQAMDMRGPETGDGAAGLSLDEAVRQIEASGLAHPYVLTIPSDPAKAWSAAHMPDKVEATRTVFLDPVSGETLADIGYDRFGPAAKAIEWGISVHQGQQFGMFNKLLMLAGCIAVWMLGLSAIVMWWKRRPRGRLAAPPAPTDRRAWWALALVVAPLAILYPLVGASLIAALTLDLIVRSALSAVRRSKDSKS